MGWIVGFIQTTGESEGEGQAPQARLVLNLDMNLEIVLVMDLVLDLVLVLELAGEMDLFLVKARFNVLRKTGGFWINSVFMLPISLLCLILVYNDSMDGSAKLSTKSGS